MSRTRILALALTAAVAIGVISPKVIAYATYGKWGTLSVDVYINPANADVTQAAATAALQAGMDVWNTQSGTAFRFNYAGKVNDTTTGWDNRNVVLFRNQNNGSTIASTYSWSSNGVLVDADTVFWDGGFTFFAGSSGCSGGAYIEDIAAHELGHALGLQHSTVPGATMTPGYSTCSQTQRTLEADDIAAVQSLYGKAGAGGATQPPTSGGGTSADGTTIPSATQIIDASGAIWTMGSNGAILRNGASVGIGYGSQILWKNSKIYVLGTADGRWYEWTGSGWINVGTSMPGGTTQPPTSGGGTSADGTTIPSATQIIDSSGAIWTMGANGAILRNGASAAGGYGSQIFWKNGKIYVLGTDNQWWEWTGAGWNNVGTSVPGGTTQPPTSGGGTSADGTTIPSATQIIDSSGAIWTMGANGAILRNGASAGIGYGSQILWKNSKIYVLGTADGRWYEWTGSGWINVGTSMPDGTTQPPTSGGGTSADGTTIPSATQIIDSSGAIWTMGANGAILRNGASVGIGYGSQMLWKNSKIYVLGTADGRWYEWTGSGWINVGTSVPGGTTQPPTSGGGTSADGTTVPGATQIIDSSGAIWTMGSSGAILRNGASAGIGYGSQILWKNSKIYVLGTADSRWYEWTGSGWLNVGATVP